MFLLIFGITADTFYQPPHSMRGMPKRWKSAPIHDTIQARGDFMAAKKKPTPYRKSFETLRPFLHLASYGCYNRKTFRQLLPNSSTYDKTLALIRQFLPSDYLEAKRTKHTLTIHFSGDHYQQLSAPLAALWETKTIDLEWMVGYCILLSGLSAHKPPYTQQALQDYADRQAFGLHDSFTDRDESYRSYTLTAAEQQAFQYKYKDGMLENQIRDRLTDLSRIGLIARRQEHKRYHYALMPDVFSHWTREDTEELYHSISFYRNVALFNTPGFTLQQHLAHTIDHPVFQCLQNSCSRLIDEDQAFLVLQAIVQHKAIRYQKNKTEYLAVPLSMETDFIYHRQYVSVYLQEKKGYRLRTLRINTLQRLTLVPIPSSFSLPDQTRRQKKQSIPLRFHYRTPAEKEHIIARLHERYPHTAVQETEDGLLACTLTARDPLRLLPWLRTFLPYIEILPAAQTLRSRLQANIQEVLTAYETV